MTLKEHCSRNANMRCHDLCTEMSPSTNIAMLLGLGSKLSVQSRKLDEEKHNEIINRFKYDTRVKYFVLYNIGMSNKPPPDSHLKGTTNMPNMPQIFEGALKRFETAMKTALKQRNCMMSTNINKLQEN